MAVLFITHKYPPSTGGMEQQSYQLITGYKAKGKIFTIIFHGQESIIMFFLKLRSRVKKILKTHPEINSIHLNDGLMAAFFILLNVSPRGRKLCVTLHGLDVVFPLALYQKIVLPLIAKKLDVIITVSKATRTACLERHFPEEKLHIIPNGVNLPGLSTILKTKVGISGLDFENDKILLAIGRPVKRKGFSWFAKDVMPLLDSSFKFVHIGHINTKVPYLYNLLPERIASIYDLFTGRANDTFALIDAANDQKCRTFITGKLSDDQRDFLIQKAAFMVMPNVKILGDMEGFGLVALEGSIMGKIVLASDIEGITDAIHDQKNGFLMPSKDAKGWSTKITELSNIDYKNSDFKTYTMQNYSWTKMVEKYSDIFNAISRN